MIAFRKFRKSVFGTLTKPLPAQPDSLSRGLDFSLTGFIREATMPQHLDDASQKRRCHDQADDQKNAKIMVHVSP
jgi:hypothetical protein